MNDITVVVNTLNEAANIGLLLRSVRDLGAQIVVVDMHSDDDTVAICRAAGARVYLHERCGYVEPARAFAMEQVSTDWVLLMDADEILTPQLLSSVVDFSANRRGDVLMIPRKNFLLGGVINHTGWSADSDRQIRFFKKTAVSFTDKIHDGIHIRPESTVRQGRFSEMSGLIHFNCLSLEEFVGKLNKYTTVEARAVAVRPHVLMPIARGLFEFGRRYFYQRGFLDGWRGLYLCICMAFYKFLVFSKAYELGRVGAPADVKAHYKDVAMATIEGSGK